MEAQKLADYERAVGDKQQKGLSTETYIRAISRRGTYNTVTFSDTECMPSILLGKSSIREPQSQVRDKSQDSRLRIGVLLHFDTTAI